ncbi:helix-turn-helix transcriptional regulator [Sphingobium estronivorans]|uniref:helix-turn-helix transcriptional regulator n=1 Tax=Sphingobium estronivorans TaxID=1577690 RepID=UPI0012399EBF|nr:helix-turn-helix transcriptional regulator [Sphingobium estronivorans]
MDSANAVDGISVPLLKLYSGLSGPDPWAEFLTSVRLHFDAAFATAILTPTAAQKPGMIVTPDVGPAAIDMAGEFFPCDPFIGLPEGQVISSTRFVGKQVYRASRFYRDYVAHYGIGDILGIDLMARSGFQMRVRICRSDDRADFTPDEHDWLGHFVPHLRTALDLYERFQALNGEDDIYDNAIEQLSIGTILLDRTGSVVRCNGIARTVLDERDTIRLVGNRLSFSSPAADRKFRKAIAEPRETGAALKFMRVERLSGRRDIGIAIRPLPSRSVGAAPTMALFLTDPQRQAALTGRAVADIFGLTPMEGEIAACLSNGLCLSQTAAILSIAQNTVRAHLRSIFDKLRVTRQSQLVQRVRVGMSGLVAWASTPPGTTDGPPLAH